MKASEEFGRRALARSSRSSQPFNIGLLIPVSGSLGLLGPSAYSCARLARDAWNERGGLGGREVRLTVLNSSETSASLDEELEQMIDAREIDALVALSNTAVCRRIAAVVKARVPLIYTPHFEGSGLPEWVHAIGETPDRQLLPAIDWMAGRYRPKRWFLLGNDYCWPRRSHAAAAPAIRATGAEIAGERYVPLGERGFDSIIDEIRACRADAVLISLVGAESIYFCRAFGAAGLAGKVLRLSVCMEENAVLGMGANNTDGMFVSAGYFATLDTEANGVFKERYRAQFGERAPMLNSLSQSVYEGFVHLNRQSAAASSQPACEFLKGVRSEARSEPFDAHRDPIFMGEVRGLGIHVVEQLAGVRT
jgi:ABC-type branched-subunit amino acid transport system substrate-binding protein